jgi:hypothetical protein
VTPALLERDAARSAGGVLSRFKFTYDDLVAIAPDPSFAGFD